MKNSLSRENFSFRAAVPSLHVSVPKTEIYLDFSIKNAGVFAYNFYSFDKHIVVELSFVLRN